MCEGEMFAEGRCVCVGGMGVGVEGCVCMRACK